MKINFYPFSPRFDFFYQTLVQVFVVSLSCCHDVSHFFLCFKPDFMFHCFIIIVFVDCFKWGIKFLFAKIFWLEISKLLWLQRFLKYICVSKVFRCSNEVRRTCKLQRLGLLRDLSSYLLRYPLQKLVTWEYASSIWRVHDVIYC